MSVFTDKWIDEHKDELVEKLQQCVRINSVRDDGSTREGAPFGEGAAKCLEDTLNTAKEMGFEVKNLDGYCGTVDYGTGEEQLRKFTTAACTAAAPWTIRAPRLRRCSDWRR